MQLSEVKLRIVMESKGQYNTNTTFRRKKTINFIPFSPRYVTSHYITPYHTTPYHITQYYTTLYRITLHYITSHHINICNSINKETYSPLFYPF